jgi:hypothetical protein
LRLNYADGSAISVTGPDRPAGHGKADHGLAKATPCFQSQIGQDRYLAKRLMAQLTPTVALSMTVRWGPLGTAMNGTLVARPQRTNLVSAWQRRSQAQPKDEAHPG